MNASAGLDVTLMHSQLMVLEHMRMYKVCVTCITVLSVE